MVQINPREERLLEDGWYPAEFGQGEMRGTKFGEKLFIPVEVEDDEGPVEIPVWVNLSDHPKATVVKWGKALFGSRPFDTDEFSGVLCEAYVEEGEDQDGNPKNHIRKVRPRKNGGKGKAKPKAKTPSNEVEEDFDDLNL